MADIVNVIKKAAMEVIENSSPSSVLFGTVINVSPLKIQVEQKMILTEEFLILTKNVKDYTVNITLNNWDTDNVLIQKEHKHETNEDTLEIENTTINFSHKHEMSGNKSITINNRLKTNDNVILIQQQGGQKFIVLDKIY